MVLKIVQNHIVTRAVNIHAQIIYYLYLSLPSKILNLCSLEKCIYMKYNFVCVPMLKQEIFVRIILNYNMCFIRISKASCFLLISTVAII